MRSTRFACLILAICALFAWNKARAQALPTNGSERIGMSLAAGIREALFRRGFAANDPRVIQTIELVSSRAAVTGASISWGQLLFNRMAVGAGITLAGSAALYVLTKVTGGFTVLVPAGAEPSTVAQVAGQPGFGFTATGSVCYAGVFPDVQSAALQFMKCNTSARVINQLDVVQQSSSANSVYYVVSAWGNNSTEAATVAPHILTGSGLTIYPLTVPSSCPGGTRSLPNGLCQGLSWAPGFFQPLPKTLTVQAPDTAINALPDGVKALPLSPAIVADLMRRAWEDAAGQPGAKVLPVQLPLPETWPLPYPDSYAPKVGDLPQPVVGTGGKAVPDPTPNPNEIKGTGQAVDLGSDPGIAAPTLEEPPTNLFQPIKDALSGWLNWSVPSHSSTCPTWEANTSFGGRVFSINISQHCAVAEQYRTTISAAAFACWALMAVFIILSA